MCVICLINGLIVKHKRVMYECESYGSPVIREVGVMNLKLKCIRVFPIAIDQAL